MLYDKSTPGNVYSALIVISDYRKNIRKTQIGQRTNQKTWSRTQCDLSEHVEPVVEHNKLGT